MKTIITAIAITLILVGAACGQSGSGADSAAKIPVATTSHSGSNIPVIDGVSRKLQSERKAFRMKDPGAAATDVRATAETPVQANCGCLSGIKGKHRRGH
jgi:hypothetical protein